MDKRNKITETEIRELKNTALYNKKEILYKTIIPEINGNKRTALRIAGVGQKAIKLDTYFSYRNLLKYETPNSLESIIIKLINTVY